MVDIAGSPLARQLALQTIEAVLEGEKVFLDGIKEKIKDEDLLAKIKAPQNQARDHIVHIAQLLFFIDALDCDHAKAIKILVTAHNEAMTELWGDREDDPAADKKLRETRFSDKQCENLVADCERLGEIAMTALDYGRLLAEHLAPKTAAELIYSLYQAGFFVRLDHDGEASKDPRRTLYASAKTLEELYAISLLVTRAKILEDRDARAAAQG